MDKIGTCFCGEDLSLGSIHHLLECEMWSAHSLLFKAARKSLKRGSSVELLLLEAQALQHMEFSYRKSPDNLVCGICQKTSPETTDFFFPDGCFHIQCKDHAVEAIYESYPTVECPVEGCSYTFNHEEQVALVGQHKLDSLKEASIRTFINNTDELFVECPCGEVSFLAPGKVELSYKDENGNVLSKKAAENMAKFRFRCSACKAVICAQCKAEPYHLGYTCEEFQVKKESKTCRYCQKVIKSKHTVCRNPECRTRYKMACRNSLQCGHPCAGIRGENNCLGCLKEECTEGQNEHDYCAICYTEGLGEAPSVKLVCGHILHLHCVLETLSKRWVGPRITFNFAKCPTCKEWIQAPESADISQKMEEIFCLFKDVRGKALKRLKYEEMEKDHRLSDPRDHYYRRKEAYALDRLSYYECFKCRKPYFGGKKECDQNQDRADYKPNELVCPSCAAVGLEGRDCPKHGKEFIEFKCKFCCNISCWFCWGNTHFCDTCHTRQNNGDYLTKKKRSELPVCPGLEHCPLKVKHPPNGEEFALGCAVCRNMKVNSHNF